MSKDKNIIVFWMILILSCQPVQKKEKENFENSKKLRIGMDFKIAVEIMGEADEIRTIKNERIFGYDSTLDSIYSFYYEVPIGTSGGIEFYSDSLKVLKIFNDMN